MKHFSFLLAAAGSLSAIAASLDLRLLSYNIRVDQDDKEPGEDPWSVRLPLMVSQINDQIVGSENFLMCFQEALRPQLVDLQHGLKGSWWSFLGWGREGGRKGEYSSIVYQDAVWEKLVENTYWFTEGLWNGVNKEGAKGWDADHPRIMNVARFKHRTTGAHVVYICTHLEYKGQKAAQEEAKLVAEYARRWSEGGKYPVFVAGDFNHEPGSDVYKNVAANMTDIREALLRTQVHGPRDTYTGFTDNTSDDELLDYVLVSRPEPAELVSFTTLSNIHKGTYISDHRPVMVDVKLRY